MSNILLFFTIFVFCNGYHETDYCKICYNKSHTMCKYQTEFSKFCSNYSSIAMTPEIQATIVTTHNDLRNKVAMGKEERGNPGPQPSSCNMKILKWDKELALIAQRWANQCVSVFENNQHDECRVMGFFEVGQNIFQIVRKGEELNFKNFVVAAMQYWYNEVDGVDSTKIGVFANIQNEKKQIGHYAQIVWAKTEFIGCAHVSFVENLKSYGFIVIDRLICNYGPRGNLEGWPIYEVSFAHDFDSPHGSPIMFNPSARVYLAFLDHNIKSKRENFGLTASKSGPSKIMPLHEKYWDKIADSNLNTSSDKNLTEKLLQLFQKFNLTLSNKLLLQMSKLQDKQSIPQYLQYLKDVEEHFKETAEDNRQDELSEELSLSTSKKENESNNVSGTIASFINVRKRYYNGDACFCYQKSVRNSSRRLIAEYYFYLFVTSFYFIL